MPQLFTNAWSSRELSLEQEELHRLAAELGGERQSISEAIDAVRKRDLGRALDTPAQVTVAGLDGFAAMARSMNAQFRIAGVEKLAKLQTTLGESLRAAASRAHISLWSSLDESQRSEIGSIEPSEVVFALGDLDEKSREMLALWLAAAPGIEACVAVAAALPRGRPGSVQGFLVSGVLTLAKMKGRRSWLIFGRKVIDCQHGSSRSRSWASMNFGWWIT